MLQMNRLNSRLALRKSSVREEFNKTEIVGSSQNQSGSPSALRTVCSLCLIVVLGLVFDPPCIGRATAAGRRETANKAGAVRFSVTDYGAKCDDQSDDSVA